MRARAPLIGRDAEVAALRGLVDDAPRAGRALVVVGDPGIGKSALVADAAAHAVAAGMTVLVTTGVQPEAHLPFAGLHQLLRPLRARAGGLTDRQREALRAAFGRRAGTPDPYVVALATVDLLSDASSVDPLLLVVEDAQWVDGPTAAALAFVARRLAADRVAMVVTARPGWGGPLAAAGLDRLVLAGLDEAAAEELLALRSPGLAPDHRRRILALAAGNPLALVELPKAAGGVPDPAATGGLPLTDRLEHAFAAQAATLGPAAQALLLVAALDDGDEVAECVAATDLLVAARAEPSAATATDTGPAGPSTASTEALRAAEEARLLRVDGDRLRFRHPLVRSALRQAAGPERRRAAHAALAAVLAGQPDRQLWHRAEAATAPDEALARALEDAARRAHRFRAAGIAVDAYRRAAQLSVGPERRGRLLLTAAECAHDMGANDLAAGLLAEARAAGLPPLERARLAWLEELLRDSPRPGIARIGPAVELIERMRAVGDVELALRSLLAVAQVAWWNAPAPEGRRLVLAAADRLPVPAHDLRMLAIRALADPVGQAATVGPLLAKAGPDRVHDPEALHLVGLVASLVGAMGEASAALAASASGLRSLGRFQLLSEAQQSRAACDLARGDWDGALAAGDEAERLGQEVGRGGVTAMAMAASAVTQALRGDPSGAVARATVAERVALSANARPILGFALLARGTAALAEGRPGDATDLLARLLDPGDTHHHPYVAHLGVVDLAEAAAGCDRQAEARGLLAPLAADAEVMPSPLLRSGVRVARALLVPDAEAEAAYGAALADPPPWPFMRGRLLLARGVWLRRQRRIAESRAPLRVARDFFDALGAAAWSARARYELRASGEASGPRLASAAEGLTPQELQVVRLAAEGLTNREVAERLFLSHRTVGAHLYRAFPKLGITTRAQLPDALA